MYNFNERFYRVCKCKHCGTRIKVDESKILTSNPPMYSYHCPICHSVDYVMCADCELVDTEDPNYNSIEYKKPEFKTEDIRDIKIRELEKRVSALEEQLLISSEKLQTHIKES